MRKTLLSATLLLTAVMADAQLYKDPSADTDARVENLLSLMTLEEKIDYIGGYTPRPRHEHSARPDVRTQL